MEVRTCSRCGQVWYSADTVTVWVCSRCGAKIPRIATVAWPGSGTTPRLKPKEPVTPPPGRLVAPTKWLMVW